jgi:hypothetical protein
MIKHIIWPLLFLSCLFDCSSFQLLPKRTYNYSSGLGITVFIDSKQNPDSIIFAKIDDNKNLFSQDIFIGSNYHVENNMYLLNAEPGKYIAVALIYKSWTLQGASNEGELVESYLYFPETMIS